MKRENIFFPSKIWPCRFFEEEVAVFFFFFGSVAEFCLQITWILNLVAKSVLAEKLRFLLFLGFSPFCKICFWPKNQGLVFWQNWDCKQAPGHICFLFVCFEPVFFSVCVFWVFGFYCRSLVAVFLLLFEVVGSQRRIVLFLNLVWELRRGGRDAWMLGNAAAEKKSFDGVEEDVWRRAGIWREDEKLGFENSNKRRDERGARRLRSRETQKEGEKREGERVVGQRRRGTLQEERYACLKTGRCLMPSMWNEGGGRNFPRILQVCSIMLLM